MKCLTITQPYASLIAFSEKRVESRSWYTPFRGIIAIHAAKRIPKDDREFVIEDEDFASVLARHGVTLDDLPLGCVVATARLVGCMTTERALISESVTYQERHFGNFDRGRYAWVLTDVVPLPVPIPAKGSLGLWELDESLLAVAS